LAIIACETLKHDTLFLWSKTYMDSITHEGGRMTELVNPNRLVRMYNGANGLQTGSSDSAGYNVVASAKRGETGYICVVIGSPNTQERFSAASALLDYGFANYEAVNITRQGETIKKSVPVKGGSLREVQIVAGETRSALLEKGQAKSLIKELELPEQLEAPLTLDQPVGELVVKNGDQEIARLPLFAKEEIEQRTFQYILLKILANWLN
jgi:D-alanyl-D-alanine carboxypeptidase (penicillin-binding protein 5/6)